MTPPETVSTTASGTPRRRSRARSAPRGRPWGNLIDAYLQDYTGPAVPVRQHRSRPDRPSRRLLRPRRAGRRAHHAPDPPVPNSPGAPPGRPPAPSTGRPRRSTAWARSPSTGTGSIPCLASPTACARILPARASSSTPEYLAVRAHLPAPWQDILDLAYYSGWRKQEILGLTWDEIDEAGGVIRLSPARSKTLVGRILPISPPISEALARRRARRDPDSLLVFHRDGIAVRRWRTAWRTACQAAGVPTRFLHDCRRTAARNLIRANVPERVAMLLTGHKSRAIFDRYNIIPRAGTARRRRPARRLSGTAGTGGASPSAAPGGPAPPLRPSASCDAPPHKAPLPGISSPIRGGGSRTPPVCALRIAARPPVRAGPRSWHTWRWGGPTGSNTGRRLIFCRWRAGMKPVTVGCFPSRACRPSTGATSSPTSAVGHRATPRPNRHDGRQSVTVTGTYDWPTWPIFGTD